MKEKVVIVGGGISGLICSYVFSQFGVDPVVLEPDNVGGEFLSGGLKYIHYTQNVVKLLNEIGLLDDGIENEYNVKGGILLRGEVHPYPTCFDWMKKNEADRIRRDYYSKTRRIIADFNSKTAMNDPDSTKPRKALHVNLKDLIQELGTRARISREKVNILHDNFMITTNGVKFFDYVVLTIPLWIIKKIAQWDVPHGMAMNLNVIDLWPVEDRYVRWDYVYTPYTPKNVIHRFSSKIDGYSIEANGKLDMDELYSDLYHLFPVGWTIRDVKTIKGHLLPLESKIAHPSNVAHLGRFAQWNSRATVDVVLDEVIKLAERWFG